MNLVINRQADGKDDYIVLYMDPPSTYSNIQIQATIYVSGVYANKTAPKVQLQSQDSNLVLNVVNSHSLIQISNLRLLGPIQFST